MKYRPKCSWRHQLKPWKQTGLFKACLVTVFFLECSFGAAQFFYHRLDQIPIITIKDTVQVEWFVPAKQELQGKQDIYGLQFDWGKGELRFYRSDQQINGH